MDPGRLRPRRAPQLPPREPPPPRTRPAAGPADPHRRPGNTPAAPGVRLFGHQAATRTIPGPPHDTVDHVRERSRVLDAHCAAIGRDPRTITRSVRYTVSCDDPARDRAVLAEPTAAGFTPLVLGLRSPDPPGVARWLVDEIVGPLRHG
ncbi:hypothetical protein [Kitasatospora sp. NPDC085464]|uniref:hypothetical protein n=1 Tax=Kitasatospora sp. NPDC085464 TaxID=3364063 RepID=UPI0037C8928E